MLNHTVIMGRLTRDPEMRYTQNGNPVASFCVAVERDREVNGQRPVDFFDAIAWKQGADFVCKHFHKGDMICVSGRMESRKWKDRDGNNRTSWEVQADNCYFTGEKRQAAPQPDVYAEEAEDAYQYADDSEGRLPF